MLSEKQNCKKPFFCFSINCFSNPKHFSLKLFFVSGKRVSNHLSKMVKSALAYTLFLKII